jgi:hypothetical protein
VTGAIVDPRPASDFQGSNHQSDAATAVMLKTIMVARIANNGLQAVIDKYVSPRDARAYEKHSLTSIVSSLV